jgi:hypothetical protein
MLAGKENGDWRTYSTAEVASTVNALSARWQNTYGTVSSLSANWQSTYGTVSSLSANWQSTHVTVSALSAGWSLNTPTANVSNAFATVRASSATWQSTYETVSALSATWSVDTKLNALSTSTTTITTLSVIDKVTVPALSFNNPYAAQTLGYRFDGRTDVGTSLAPASGIWQDIVVGTGTNVFALSNNRWFAAGRNQYGELGLGHTNTVTSFEMLTGNWQRIVTGYQTNFALSGNKWFVTGSNQYGQMGLSMPLVTNFNTFTPLTGDWIDVVPGIYKTFALSGAKWFAAGENSIGALGIDRFSGSFPTAISNFTMLTGNWSKILAGGNNFTWALSADTTRWHAVGSNSSGQLSIPTAPETQICTFRAVTGNWSNIQTANNAVFALSTTSGTAKKWFFCGRSDWYTLTADGGSISFPPTFQPELTDWDDVSLGGDNYWQSLYLLSGATWYVRGINGGMSNWPYNTTAKPLGGQIAKIFNKYGQANFAFVHSQQFTLSTCITDQYTQFAGVSTGLFLPVSVNNVAYKIPLHYPGSIVTISSISVS